MRPPEQPSAADEQQSGATESP